jgi:hypothetical protein
MYGNTLQAICNYKRNKIQSNNNHSNIQMIQIFFFFIRADKSHKGTMGIPDWHIKKLW